MSEAHIAPDTYPAQPHWEILPSDVEGEQLHRWVDGYQVRGFVRTYYGVVMETVVHEYDADDVVTAYDLYPDYEVRNLSAAERLRVRAAYTAGGFSDLQTQRTAPNEGQFHSLELAQAAIVGTNLIHQ